MARLKVQCQTCVRSRRKGFLWLAGDDWLECPDCNATGLFDVIEERFTPKERTVLVPRLRSHVERAFHPSVAHLQDIACRFTA